MPDPEKPGSESEKPLDIDAIERELHRVPQYAKPEDILWGWAKRNGDLLISKVRSLTHSNAELSVENERLKGAIKRAGFSVMQTSGEWSIHDVSEAAEAIEARTLETVNENIDLTIENERLKEMLKGSLKPRSKSVLNRIRACDEYLLWTDASITEVLARMKREAENASHD